jgi:selenocysteine lyase/cysteine desulfurase
MVYIARRHLERLELSWTGWGAQEEGSLDLPNRSFKRIDSARRFEFATKSWPLFRGLDTAIQFVEGVGLAAIETRVRYLTSYLKSEIARIPGLTLLTPRAPERCAGLVSVAFDNYKGPNLHEVFWDRWQMLIASSDDQRWLRLSVAFFTLEEELDQAVAALRTLASEGQAAPDRG